jgi:hypothetical protein
MGSRAIYAVKRDFSHTADAVDQVRELRIALVRIELAKSGRDIAQRCGLELLESELVFHRFTTADQLGFRTIHQHLGRASSRVVVRAQY